MLLLTLWSCAAQDPVVDTGWTGPHDSYGTLSCYEGDGEVWVMSGASLLAGELGPGDALAIVRREAEFSRWLHIGQHMAALPDLDGDGLGELAVSWGPRVSVLSGASLASGTADLEAPLATFAGDDVGDTVDGLQAIGDLDGDGLDDLAIVQTQDYPATGSTVVLTSAQLSSGGTFGPADAWVRLQEEARNIAMLRAGVGDLDGDGAEDLALLGSFTGDDDEDDSWAGRRLQVWLAADLAAGGVRAATEASATVQESAELPLHHSRQGRIGDLDGDGADDLLLGLHIFSGAALSGEHDIDDAWSAPGADLYDDGGLAWMDTNGDGVSELLLQDYGWAAGGAGGLSAQLVSGASWTDGHGLGTVLASTGHDVDHLVQLVGSVSDLDGDGVDEAWALIAHGSADTLPELRLWSGAELGAGWDLAAPDGRIELPDCGWNSAVVALGDLDGDGRSELAVSLPENRVEESY